MGDPTLHCDAVDKSISSMALKDVYYDYELDCDSLFSDIWEESFNICGVKRTVYPDIDAEKLVDLWHISITNAARTLKCVDMDRIREIKSHIHKRFKPKAHQRRYKQL